MWLNLLSKGDAIYIAEPLSGFRIHKGQDQQKPSILYQCISAWPQILNGARKMGFLENPYEAIRAIKTFSRVSQSWEEKPVFTESQRSKLSTLRIDLEAELPTLLKHAQTKPRRKSHDIALTKQLKRIRRHDSWNGPLKYVYVRGKLVKEA